MARTSSICNRCRCLNALAVASAFVVCAAAQSPHVVVKGGEFRLEGASDLSRAPAAGWESLFRIYAGAATTPMLGSYSVDSGALIFHPRFPLRDDIGYHGVFPGGDFAFDASPQRAPSTRVERVYPSASTLPANTLKLYVYFSAPMSAGEAWQHIHLLDKNGSPLRDVFLEIEPELWDETHQRLTVLFDPARIKRGLVPAREAGTPIVEGMRYTLAIDREWRDARGIPLLAGARKDFMGAPPDRTPPSPLTWRLTTPASGNIQPLVVTFPKSMDHALLQRMLSVPGIQGAIAIANDEKEWRLTPASPWRSGSYRLIAEPGLEDIAGNHPDRPFDADRNTPATTTDLSVSFRID